MENELNKLKAEKLILQKQLAREKSENLRLGEIIQETEALVKRKTEEVEALQIYNNQLIHKCESLQASGKQSQWGLWWGKGQKVDARISILEEELANKIAENEQVHIKIFEIRQKYKGKIGLVKERLKGAEELVRDSAFKIEGMSIEIGQYQHSLQNLIKENKEYSGLLDDKNKEIQDLQQYFLKTITELKTKVLYLEGKLRSTVSLDLTDYNQFSKYIPPKYSKNLQFKQTEWINKAKTSLKNSTFFINTLLVNYSTRLNAIHMASSMATKKIVSEITSQTRVLSSIYEELVKSFCENLSKDKVLRLLLKFDSALTYFVRIVKMEILRQGEIVVESEKISKCNQGFVKVIGKICRDVSRIIAFLGAGGSSFQCFWVKVQECCRTLVFNCNEAVEIFESRLVLDKTLKYKGSLQELSLITEKLSEDLKSIPGNLNQFYSEIMQIKPSFYYNLSSAHITTSNYLQKLRNSSISSGISYTDSLENINQLRTIEDNYKKQSETLNEAEKNNKGLVKEIERLKAEVVRVENELAAVEQNFERKTIETGGDLVPEPESISEDVKSGAQRFALRLTDCNGEPVPLSQLTVANDVFLKIQELAVHRIMEIGQYVRKVNSNI